MPLSKLGRGRLHIELQPNIVEANAFHSNNYKNIIIEYYAIAGNQTIVVKQSENKNFHPDTGLPFFVGQTIFVPNDTGGAGVGTQKNKLFFTFLYILI